MTDLLDQAIARVRALPDDAQDEFARVLLRLAGDEEPIYQMSEEEEASFALSRLQADRGEFTSDEDMRALWQKYRL